MTSILRRTALACPLVAAVLLVTWPFVTLGAAQPEAVALGVPGRSNSTPWIAAAGSFVAVTWTGAADGKGDVYLAASRDGGRTFDAPVQVNAITGEARVSGELPPRVALITKGTDVPDVTVLWTTRTDTTEIKSARSRDGGKTFEAPVTVQTKGAAGDRGWPSLALDAQGAAHVVWLDHRGMAARKAAGATHTNHAAGAVHDGAAMAQASGLYYASVNNTASPERELTKGVCYCCKTALATGPNNTVFAAWRHVYPGNLRDMAFTVSRDGGRSFAKPIRVSEDNWALNGCPDDGPAMSVDVGGTIHVVWPTVVDGPQPEGAIFYASSKDGRTFTARIRVPTQGTPKPSHPQVVVDRTGRVFVAWDEYIGNRRVAALREVRLDQQRVAGFGDLVTLTANGSSMYPVMAATDSGLVSVWTTGGDASTVFVRTLAPPD